MTFAVSLNFGCAPAVDDIPDESGSTPETTTEEMTTTQESTTEFIEEENDDEVKFLIFADFHYKKKMYASSIEDMNKLLDRAANHDVDFVIQSIKSFDDVLNYRISRAFRRISQ